MFFLEKKTEIQNFQKNNSNRKDSCLLKKGTHNPCSFSAIYPPPITNYFPGSRTLDEKTEFVHLQIFVTQN